jgi:hypothetical protein
MTKVYSPWLRKNGNYWINYKRPLCFGPYLYRKGLMRIFDVPENAREVKIEVSLRPSKMSVPFTPSNKYNWHIDLDMTKYGFRQPIFNSLSIDFADLVHRLVPYPEQKTMYLKVWYR